MKSELRTLLANAGGVTALVPSTSILWAKREGLPSIALWVVSDVPQAPTMKAPTKLNAARVQVDCWAPTADEADDIAEAVLAVVNGFKGDDLRGVFLLDRQMSAETDTAAPDADTPADFQRSRLDLRVWHRSAN